MNDIYLGFTLSTLAGLSTIIGFIIILFVKKKKDIIIISSLAFSSGVMSFLSITDLIPEGIKYIRDSIYLIPSILICFIFILIGIFISFLLDKFIPNNISNNKNKLFKVGIISMLGIIIHNIPEGIATFVTISSNMSLGISLSIAIALHNIPEGISVSLPIYYANNSKKKAFIYTFISGISEPIGAFLAYLFLAPIITKTFLGILFSFIAGIMLHISFKELLPTSMQYKRYKISILFYILGALFVIINHFIF